MSIARHAAIAAVTGTVIVAVAVVLLSNGVPGAGGATAGTQPGTSAPPRPGAAVPSPATGRPAPPTAAPTTVPAAPRVRSDDPRLGPYDAQAGCLRAGNAGMGDGSWDDYECVGGAGNWRIQPQR